MIEGGPGRINISEYDKVHGCETAKEMWDTLAMAHEGTSQVKESKISILVHQYELFKMKEDESIEESIHSPNSKRPKLN